MLNIPFQVQNVATTYKFSTLPGAVFPSSNALIVMVVLVCWYFKRAATKSLMQITMSRHKRVTTSVQRSTSPPGAHLNQTNEKHPAISHQCGQILIILVHAGVFCSAGRHLSQELPALPSSHLALSSSPAEEEHRGDLPHPHHHVLP